MVLDFIISPSQAKRDPWSLAIASAIFVSFGVLVEMYMPIKGSIIIFTMVPAIPLIWTLLLKESKEEEDDIEGWTFGRGKPRADLFTRHLDLWEVFAFFFLGAAVAYTFWFALLPQTQAGLIFDDQLKEVNLIRGAALTGKVAGFLDEGQFWFLFTHNLQVLGLMFAFSVIYGIGSIYLLLWNASIIGVVIGQKVHSIGLLGAVLGFFSLLPHGIFELSAYFVASIGGGLLSIELMRKRVKPGIAKHIFFDIALLAIVSLVLLAIGAAIEAAY
ncbi:MAG TPA: stage II sporulation protein M [Candidatus Norongarragalinales archaeon]|nr:stage II sporulation protein M [Candidatus Norongarragalinales archaeon]